MSDPTTEELVLHADAWANVATGIGGPKDKSSGFRFSGAYIGSAWNLLEDLYEQDHIAGRIVDAVPEAVFANGTKFECADPRAKEAILDTLDELEAEDAIDQAMRWERLYGGAAIFVGTDDERRFDQPLEPAAVRKVLYLHVFDRWELQPSRFYDDPRHPKFGRPSHYRVSPMDSHAPREWARVSVHESRLIIFGGQITTKRKLIEEQYWGQSVLVRSYNAIKQYGGSMASVLALMADASQGVYKIKGLMNIIQGGNEASLLTRMKAQERIRSAMNAILLDAEGESYERVAQPLTELGNLVDRFMINVASAANMPATEIFGRSAAGLNATGENDTRSWYKQIEKVQRKSAKKAYERLLRLVMRSAKGPTKGQEPESWKFTFPPVWSPTPKESAEIKKSKMETAVLGLDAQALTPHQIARGLFSGSEWDGEITLEPDEINALRGVAMAAGMAVAPPAPSVGSSGEDPDDVEVQESTDAEGEALADLNPRELAATMTELGIQRCEHQKLNRCRLCGVERHRQVTGVDSEGNGIWATAWRAIGEKAPSPEERDEDSAGATSSSTA